MTLYFISGLGVDRRAFIRVQLPPSIKVVHLDWIPPLGRETMAAYARRLAEPIDTREPFGLVGLSLGGMIASEMAKILEPRFVFLLSSAATCHEIPPLYKALGRLGLHKIIPARLFKLSPRLAYEVFRAKSKNEKELLRSIIQDSDPLFIKWGVGAILGWRNTTRPKNLFHIHGVKDIILPIGYCQPDVSVPTAGHLMVFTHAHTVSRFIAETVGR